MSEAAKFKLTYFEFRSRAEPARLLFAKANIPFIDKRITYDDWPELKPSMISPPPPPNHSRSRSF